MSKWKRYRAGFIGTTITHRGTGSIDTSLGGGPGSGRKKKTNSIQAPSKQELENIAESYARTNEIYSGLERIGKEDKDMNWQAKVAAYAFQAGKAAAIEGGQQAGRWAKNKATNYIQNKLPSQVRKVFRRTRAQNSIKSPNTLVFTQGGSATRSAYVRGKYFKLGYGWMRLKAHKTKSFRLVSELGKQKMHVNKIHGTDDIKVVWNYWMPKVNLTADGTGETDTAVVDNTAVILYRTVSVEYLISHSSNIVSYLTIYDSVPKLDATNSFYDSWLEAVADSSYPSTGRADSNGADGVFTTDVGTTPTSHRRFNKQWKVNKITKVKLIPGQVHKHFVRYNFNRKIDHSVPFPAHITDKTAYLTPYTSFVLYGSPIHDTDALADAGSEENADITYGKSAIDVIVKSTVHYAYKPNTYYVLKQNELLTATGTGQNTITTPTTVDEDGQETEVIV